MLLNFERALTFSSQPELVGLFPSFNFLGGIQASGREAWRGIVQDLGATSTFRFDYRPNSGKTRAVFSALRNRKTTGTILIWHLNLLKLSPFLSNAKRTVVFLHGVEAWRRLDRVTEWALRKTDLILSNSRYTWERFVTANPAFQTSLHCTVHLGAGNEFVGTVPPVVRPIALMLGRMARSEDYKGHRQMIGAWPQVLQLLPEAKLWIAGEGDLRPELEILTARLRLSDSVKFFGPVSETQKVRLVTESRCLALPSRAEGFGLAYLEAMRVGRPCLIGDQDAAREVVEPPCAGLAVDPGNSAQIAESAVRLLTAGPAWDRWSAAARARYESCFTARHFHRRLNRALAIA